MPESKPRRKPTPTKSPAQKRAERAAKREALTHVDPPAQRTREERLNRDPAKPIPEEARFPLPELPEPADYLEVLVALAKMDPLAQEVMIAERLAAMPSQRDGSMPVNIPRMVRGPWAHQLRKLGVYVIPELATHELVAPDGTGMMVNHTAGSVRKIEPGDIWDKVKKMNPDLAQMVDAAETPEQKREAMAVLLAKMPVDQRIAVQRLAEVDPRDLEPT